MERGVVSQFKWYGAGDDENQENLCRGGTLCEFPGHLAALLPALCAEGQEVYGPSEAVNQSDSRPAKPLMRRTSASRESDRDPRRNARNH